MNILRFLLLFIFFKFNFLIAAEPLPFNNIVLHKNPLQVSQVKLKDFYLKDIELNKNKKFSISSFNNNGVEDLTSYLFKKCEIEDDQ